MLKKERKYGFRERMLQIHHKDIRNFELKAEKNEFELADGVLIAIGKKADIVVETAAKDFADYLLVSMNVAAAVITKSGLKGAVNVVIADDTTDMTGADATKGFRIDTDEDGITVTGFDARGCAQGLYYLEKCMTRRKAPFIQVGTIKKKPLFSPQMVHSGYGLDHYPNEHLAQIAHEGRDAIVIFVKDVDITPYGYLDFNELIYRAARYGIDVYAYSYIVNKMHPEDEGGVAYYEGTYGRLFKECPKLKGIILVEDGQIFPSKDPAVRPDTQLVDNVTSIPVGKPCTAEYPASDFTLFLTTIKNIIQKYNKDAEFIVWSYTIQRKSDPGIRHKWISLLPEGTTLLATMDKNEVHVNKAGALCYVIDYSLSNPVAARNFLSDIQFAHKRGLKVYAMTNTGGLTWDMGVMPYQPGAQLWMKRYESLLEATRIGGICGLMECHHYGFCPSFISSLANEVYRDQSMSMEQHLDDVLLHDFGGEHIETIKKALQCMSDSNACYTHSSADSSSALRVGAAWPLCIKLGLKPPTVPYALFGNRIVADKYETDWNMSYRLNAEIIPEELESWKVAVQYAHEGVSILETIKNPNENLERLLNLCRYIECQCVSAVAAKSWFLAKQRLDLAKADEVPAIVEEMTVMAKEEIKNAERAIACAEVDSRLGWEPSMEYIADAEHLRWKIAQVNYAVGSELGEYLKAAREES